jgi:hypothetical protein
MQSLAGQSWRHEKTAQALVFPKDFQFSWNSVSCDTPQRPSVPLWLSGMGAAALHARASSFL